jgi:hypothetical protein
MNVRGYNTAASSYYSIQDLQMRLSSLLVHCTLHRKQTEFKETEDADLPFEGTEDADLFERTEDADMLFEGTEDADLLFERTEDADLPFEDSTSLATGE